jgi:hypothetical protein
MANDIDKTSPHYKGEFGSIYEVNQKFPNGGVAGDYVEIDGWAHYWNANRGTWCVNAQRDSYWDELITGIIEKFKLFKGATYMGVAGLDTVPAKAIGAKMYYFATVAGTYKRFGGLVVPQGINVLYSENGSSWVCSTLLEVAQELGVSTRNVVSQKVVNDALNLKANQSSVNEALAKKFDKESVAQEPGDSEELVMSQKAVSDKLCDLSKQIYHIEGKESEIFNDTIENNGYYNSFTNKEQYKNRKIYKKSSVVFNATELSDNASISVEVRKVDTYATYVDEIGILTAASPSLIVESWDYENCLYGFNTKNIDSPVSITTETKLTGKIEQIEATIGTKILKPSSSIITINGGESYMLMKNLDFQNVTLNMSPNSRIIFNGYTIACNYLTLVSSFREEDGINNAPMLDFSKTGGFNVKVGTCNMAGLFRTDNNKLNIHSFSFDPRFDLEVISHFKNTEFYITKSFKSLYNASKSYSLDDNCSLYSINDSTITLESPIKINGKNVFIHDLACKGSYCFNLLEDSSSFFENVKFNETESSISCISTSRNDFSKLTIRNCKFMNNGTGIGVEGLFKNSIFEYNTFNCRSSIRISRGYNNIIHFNTILSGITGILNSFSLFPLSKKFVIKNGFSGNSNNVYSNNKLYNIAEENISFDYTPVNTIYKDGKIPLNAPNRNSCVISSIITTDDFIDSAIVTFDGIDIFEDGEDAIPYYKNMIIYYLKGNKVGTWSVIESVTKQNNSYKIKVKGNNTFWLGAVIGDRLSVSCGFVNNTISNNTYYNTPAPSVAFYIGCFGCVQNDEIIIDRKLGNWDSISYIQGVRKIPRSINVYSCDNTIRNVRCINDMSKEDRPSRIVMQASELVEEVEIPNDITNETLFKNTIENCIAGSLQLHDACYKVGDNKIIGGIFGKLINNDDANKIYIINSLIKAPVEARILKNILLEGSILYNNGKLNYKNAAELISL